MESMITRSKQDYLKFTIESYNDRKVLLLWDEPKELCKRCNIRGCVGRMNVRKDVHIQYGMGVCKECFLAEE